MAWYLNASLTQFRSEVNAAYPNRDKTSDGTIGDESHVGTGSDHNPDAPPEEEVDAWDMDTNLNGASMPPPVADIERLKLLFQAHPSSWYWIHNRVIASRDTGWKRFPYSGRNPHDKHVHWNTREAHDEITTPFGVPLTITELHRLLYSILTADEQTERQVRDMITGGVHSPAGGKGLLTPVLEAIAASGLVPVEAIRQVVREEIDKTRLGVE